MSRRPQSGGSSSALPRTSGLRPPSAGVRTSATGSAPAQPPRPSSSRQSQLSNPNVVPARPVSSLQKQVFRQALSKSAADPRRQVQSTGARASMIKTPSVQTSRGPEKVLQQLVVDKTVQRTPRAEYVAKTLTGVDVKPTGTRKIELTKQRIDPTHATESAGVNQTVSVTSSLSITARGKLKNTVVKKRTVKSAALVKKANLNPSNLNRLVREETEDVENTLRMAPPEIVASSAIDKQPLKKKLQNLRINSESVAMLERAVIYPTPTADEVELEAAPEVIASIIGAVEKGASPKSDPNQIFNTLFPQVQNDRVELSSVAPGPLQDIVIPTEMPRESTDKTFTDEMRKAITEVAKTEVEPKDDVCTQNNIQPAKRTKTAARKNPVMITREVPPWGAEDVAAVSQLVGAEPIFTIRGADVTLLETSMEDSLRELAKGLDYYLDADTLPFENRVQLRGSKPPAWFPGYMCALPHIPEVVRVNKTPSEVMLAAWRTVQPKIFPEESVVVV